MPKLIEKKRKIVTLFLLIILLQLQACDIIPKPKTKLTNNYQPAKTYSPQNYTVKKGDTLYRIAKRNGWEPKHLAQANNIKPPYNIYPGQTLKFLPSTHKVEKGDTLYAIAWLYQIEHKTLAKWNNIKPPYVIHPNQKITLKPPKRKITKRKTTAKKTPPKKRKTRTAKAKPKKTKKTKKSRTKTAAKTRRKTTTKTQTRKKTLPKKTAKTKRPKTAQKKTTTAKRKTTTKAKKKTAYWQWPTTGKIIQKFSTKNIGRQGIDISGKKGQPIKATSGGKVVYSGNGLRGFGNLIIIKHNEKYLSAYAHNSKILVKEGTWVKKGQKIAEMGDTGTNRTKLHFEIRKYGKPVNPQLYLAKR